MSTPMLLLFIILGSMIQHCVDGLVGVSYRSNLAHLFHKLVVMFWGGALVYVARHYIY